MEAVFLKLVNLSITASWLMLAILGLRLVFRKAPRWIFCLLWGLVALRLVCPVSIESALSLVPSAQTLPPEILYTDTPRINSGINAINSAVNPVLAETMTPEGLTSANPTQIWSFIFACVWVFGMAAMILYALGSYLRLKHRVSTATLLRGNIRQSERVDTPFVLGLFRPVIYLPYQVGEEDQKYVIAHEQAHIRRRDHWWKPLGFVLLSVYWFNPLLWAAYVLLCRDIEGACDEKVIRSMGTEERRGYSTALLNCSICRRGIAACPLAFGEVGVKKRVKAVMHYKRPAFWIVAAALAACAVAAVCFLTDPVSGAASPAGKIYHYEGEGIGGDFAITIHEDGSFVYSEGPLSSYLGCGEWSISGDVLTLTEQAEPERVNRFRIDADKLVFQEAGSDNFIYVKVEEGEVFRGTPIAEADRMTAVIQWFDYTQSPSEMDWEQELTTQVPQFEETTFRYTPEQITVQHPGDRQPVTLITGMPIWNAYFCDFTGDGLPEICATLSWGSGIVDTRVVLYDYANGASYLLEDRGNYNYSLWYNDTDGFLYVDKRSHAGDILESCGRLAYLNGCIQVLDASGEAYP